ncbi:TIR domain-containing protein [Pseudomonas knackmussii]|uniref:toll/interleukin-1 receptor domain-containing protein n=1 Tax=Pseudomonas knackmussii TaxID=65741 RepID=UPI003BE40E9B
MSKVLFISHAVKDKALADALVDLLQTGIGLNSDQIFCSSLESLGIPSGANFVDHIKSEIQSPAAVLALITPNYFASQFCLCELGATWAMSLKLFPLLVKPLTYEDVRGVLTGVQLTQIDSATRLSELRDQLNASFGLKGDKSARWETKRDSFLKSLPKILKKLPVLDQISQSEHAKVLSELEDARQYMKEQEDELENLKSLVSKLEKAKDKNEVAAIKRTASDEAEQLEQLEADFGLLLDGLPKHVSYVACKEMGLNQEVKIDRFENAELASELENAAGRKLINIDEYGFCSLNDSHPKIKKVFNAYRALERCIENSSTALSESFEEEHDSPLSLDNSDYWTIRLDPRLDKVYF